MTPLLAALSSFLLALRSAASAAFLSPAVMASRVARTAVLSSLLTALLRSCAFLLVPMRLICDLMFAMDVLSFVGSVSCRAAVEGRIRRIAWREPHANQGSTL